MVILTIESPLPRQVDDRSERIEESCEFLLRLLECLRSDFRGTWKWASFMGFVGISVFFIFFYHGIFRIFMGFPWVFWDHR